MRRWDIAPTSPATEVQALAILRWRPAPEAHFTPTPSCAAGWNPGAQRTGRHPCPHPDPIATRPAVRDPALAHPCLRERMRRGVTRSHLHALPELERAVPASCATRPGSTSDCAPDCRHSKASIVMVALAGWRAGPMSSRGEAPSLTAPGWPFPGFVRGRSARRSRSWGHHQVAPAPSTQDQRAAERHHLRSRNCSAEPSLGSLPCHRGRPAVMAMLMRPTRLLATALSSCATTMVPLARRRCPSTRWSPPFAPHPHGPLALCMNNPWPIDGSAAARDRLISGQAPADAARAPYRRWHA
jgi:hypothetical protein